jgi:hypothetical protein
MKSIVSFRRRLDDIVAAEAAGRRRDVVVLAIDGIPVDLARQHWTAASTIALSSVFPTTSSTAWLSSLAGQPVEVHGVPGVVFRDAAGELINIYREATLPPNAGTTIFTDALMHGYRAVAIAGDLQDLACGWRRALLRDAEIVWDNRFYTRADGSYQPVHTGVLLNRIEGAIHEVLSAERRQPLLLWCFIETDLHVHHFGYDPHVEDFLAGVDVMARRLAEAGAIVLAHSDHGLTPTRQSPQVVELFEALQADGAALGGAGRTRWIYPAPGRREETYEAASRALNGHCRVEWADIFFAPGTAARAAVGDIVIVAESEAFLASPGYTHEHGSLSERELFVPFSVWSG